MGFFTPCLLAFTPIHSSSLLPFTFEDNTRHCHFFCCLSHHPLTTHFNPCGRGFGKVSSLWGIVSWSEICNSDSVSPSPSAKNHFSKAQAHPSQAHLQSLAVCEVEKWWQKFLGISFNICTGNCDLCEFYPEMGFWSAVSHVHSWNGMQIGLWVAG